MTESEQKTLQKHLARFIVEDVFNTVTAEDILQIKAPNKWLHKGRELTPEQVSGLREEAKAIFGSNLWKILSNEVKFIAHQSGYVKSTTVEDQIASKMLQHAIEIIDERLEKMLK